MHRTQDSKKDEKDENTSREEGARYTGHRGPTVHRERMDKAEQGLQEGQSGTVTRPGHRLCRGRKSTRVHRTQRAERTHRRKGIESVGKGQGRARTPRRAEQDTDTEDLEDEEAEDR